MLSLVTMAVVAATVLRTGHPHRIDDYSAVADPIARSARDRGIESSVGIGKSVEVGSSFLPFTVTSS